VVGKVLRIDKARELLRGHHFRILRLKLPMHVH
jgi:hypothetical protein